MTYGRRYRQLWRMIHVPKSILMGMPHVVRGIWDEVVEGPLRSHQRQTARYAATLYLEIEQRSKIQLATSMQLLTRAPLIISAGSSLMKESSSSDLYWQSNNNRKLNALAVRYEDIRWNFEARRGFGFRFVIVSVFCILRCVVIWVVFL